ncbi:MAG: tRNA N6-adenosine threonylcarbamoyltransferase [Chlamydiia bacterium]|nr:tRNA N6-adenosine threonylcarbamoyltransferase [Chlamydiia bacterium]MCH9618168.1 tRNA N6-adenosine threonylcarbamoyltransferase [Chlamydiia bacterium]MCH9624478.1 tRNA N6-adenosine threonylcarbamoyltransferase [Chlamydiia bacterium]
MITLGIESSCDETAAAIYDGETLLSNIVLSQIELHKEFGGVFPELAARRHLDHLIDVIDKALLDANLTKKDIDLIAVASSPGLIGALLMGVNCAKSLGFALNIPVIGVNHVEAHLFANFIDTDKEVLFPAIGLIASGGHTALFLMKSKDDIHLLGTTLDDAIGECFDKVARMLDLPYPGGPEIEKLAQSGDPLSYPFKTPSIKNAPFHFSFSGIKTKILYTLYGQNGKRDTPIIPKDEYKNIAASFQKTVFKSLLNAVKKAHLEFPARSFLIGGGVSCNKALKVMFEENLPSEINICFPKKNLTLDNAAMIAALGHYKYRSDGPSPRDFTASPSSKTTSLSFCV